MIRSWGSHEHITVKRARARNDSTAMGFGDRHALTARPGRDGQRRAWVLWRQSIGGPPEWGFPQEAHTNVSECMAGEAVQNRAEERARPNASCREADETGFQLRMPARHREPTRAEGAVVGRAPRPRVASPPRRRGHAGVHGTMRGRP